MLLLAIPMYAAPFVLLSLMFFAVFVATKRLRRFAIAALVSPIAFGGGAAAGSISWFLVCALLRIELRPITGLHGALDVVTFFLAPGVLGSAAAVCVANKSYWVWRNLPIAPTWKGRTSAVETDS